MKTSAKSFGLAVGP